MLNVKYKFDDLCDNLAFWKKFNSARNAKYYIILLYFLKTNGVHLHMMHKLLKESK